MMTANESAALMQWACEKLKEDMTRVQDSLGFYVRDFIFYLEHPEYAPKPEIVVEVKTPKAKTEGKVVKVDFAKPQGNKMLNRRLIGNGESL